MLAFLVLIFGIYFFVRSWFGYVYKFLPTANDTENYREKLLATYKDFENRDSLVSNAFDNYLYKAFIESSTTNTTINELRSLFFHRTASSLIASFVLSLITVAFFYFAGLDSQKDAIYKVNVITPIQFQGTLFDENALVQLSDKQTLCTEDKMSEKEKKAPPPPPPGPPLRQIKEGTETKRKPQTQGGAEK
jgi:hypothetical protein